MKIALIRIVFAALLMLACSANAQMYFKCTNASGKVEFSDKGCAGSSKGEIKTHSANTVDTSGFRRQIEVKKLPDDQPSSSIQEPQLDVSNSTSNVCPTENDIRSLETSASSISLSKKELSFLQAEIRRARACKKEGGQYTSEDWKAIQESQRAMGNIQPRDRDAARARAEGIHAPAASDRENARMIADKKLEAQEQAARRIVVRPTSITNCDSGGCWDNLGGRYNKAAGNNYFSSDGKFCQQIGAQLQCR